MNKLLTLALVAVAMIHLIPSVGVLGVDQLASLYDIQLHDDNIILLMRHRAVLFGLLGVFILIAAFRASLQLMAIVAGLVSVISFLLLAATVDGITIAINKVLWVDRAALVILLIAAWLYAIQRRK